MIISKSVKIELGNRNYKRLTKLYNIDIELYKPGDIVDIPVTILSESSKLLVDVRCDYCNKELNIPYVRYVKGTKVIDKYSCSNKECSNQKIKDVCQEKYGVDNPFQEKETKKKIKKTLLKRYGVDHPMKSIDIKNKIIETNLEKYGVPSYTQTKEYLEKTIKTNLERYGAEFESMTEEGKENRIKTCLLKYGTKYAIESEYVREKIKNKPKQSKESKIKTKEGFIERLGVDNPMKSEIVRSNFKISNDKNYIKYLRNSISLFNCDKKHTFEISSVNYISRIKNNVDLCTVCNPIGESQSVKEKELFEYINDIYDNEIIQSYRDRLEIDIYLPELKIGFEFNGLYWHSEKHKDKYYHVNKTNHFKKKGIRVIHIWEDDWIFRRDIIKSQIKNWIGLTKNKIFARKCVVKEIKDSKISSKFLNKNHIQGGDRSKLKLGLYHNDELVSLMTFNKNEGRIKMKDGEWNLSRFCNLLNTNVVGGASKLFNHFIRNYKTHRVISYADNDWSVGGLYERLGFDLINRSNPDYKYIVENKRVNKSKYRKDNLKIKDISESEYMKKSHILRIWDCGKIKFEINL